MPEALINRYQSDVYLFTDGETIRLQEGKTQGDFLAMDMYAIGTIPLIHQLSNESIKQTCYVDDTSVSGDLSALRRWWDHLAQIDPQYGYYLNAPKIWLIVKEELLSQAKTIFLGLVCQQKKAKVLGKLLLLG